MMKHLSLSCLCLCALALVAADFYIPERTKLVTHSEQGNFLFRGNEPLDENGKGSLVLDKMHESFVSEASANGVQLPDEYFLIDISFLDPNTFSPDNHDIRVEKREAGQHKNVKFLLLELDGEKKGPYQLSASTREKSAKKVPIWLHDKLPRRISAVHNILTTKSDLPIVVYAHCEQGIDRTGEFIGSYALKYLGHSWDKVNTDNHAIAGRPPMGVHQNALQWYCEYLRVTENPKLGCSAPPPESVL